MFIKRLTLNALLFVFVFVTLARADSTDDFVAAKMRERHVPGVAVAVIRDGKTTKARGYGVASVEHDVTVTTRTVFEIGSISKQMTAVAILLLVEQGKVKLDDKISSYLPDAPLIWRDVTIRNLITHTSGIKNYTGLNGFALSENLNAQTFVERISKHEMNFVAGAKLSYSNSGYNLLGYIIEKVSGKPYWTFMRERIFQPLGMNATGDRNPVRIVKHRANGYEWNKKLNQLEGRDGNLTDVFAAGAIVASLDDMIRWNNALDGEKLLKRATLTEAWTPFKLNDGTPTTYGLGWYIETINNRQRIRHGGQTAGFAASITRYPAQRLSIIVLSNLGDIGLGGEIANGIAELYLTASASQAHR